MSIFETILLFGGIGIAIWIWLNAGTGSSSSSYGSSSSSTSYNEYSVKSQKPVVPYPMESHMDNKVLGVYDKISELCAFCFLHIIPNFVNVEEIQMYIGYSDTDNRCAVTM